MAKLRNNGFTLMEVVLALGLFAIAMSSLPTVLFSNAHANVFARRLTAAAGFAQDEIEIIRNIRYTNVTSGTDSPSDPADSIVYTRTWTVSAGPTVWTKNVAVIVSWTDQSTHQVEIDAIIGA